MQPEKIIEVAPNIFLSEEEHEENMSFDEARDEALLDDTVTIYAKDGDGQQHLHTVAEANIAKTVKMLIQKGLFGITVLRK